MGGVEKDKKIFVQNCAQCHTVEKEVKHKTGIMVHLEGRKVRLLDSLTQTLTLVKVTPRKRIL